MGWNVATGRREEVGSRSFCSGLSLEAWSLQSSEAFSSRRPQWWSADVTLLRETVWCACDDVVMLVPQWASVISSEVVKVLTTDVGGIDVWEWGWRTMWCFWVSVYISRTTPRSVSFDGCCWRFVTENSWAGQTLQSHKSQGHLLIRFENNCTHDETLLCYARVLENCLDSVASLVHYELTNRSSSVHCFVFLIVDDTRLLQNFHLHSKPARNDSDRWRLCFISAGN